MTFCFQCGYCMIHNFIVIRLFPLLLIFAWLYVLLKSSFKLHSSYRRRKCSICLEFYIFLDILLPFWVCKEPTVIHFILEWKPHNSIDIHVNKIVTSAYLSVWYFCDNIRVSDILKTNIVCCPVSEFVMIIKQVVKDVVTLLELHSRGRPN